MRTIGYRLLVAALSLALLAGARDPPAALQRGINITHWFRFPPSRDPAALRDYLDDAALEALRRAGFTFLRIPVQPDLLGDSDALSAALARIQRHHLAVVVALFAADWHLESNALDRARLLATWRSLGPVLRPFDPALTFPEVLNEPVFTEDPDGWAALQHQAAVVIRGILPNNAIVLTGARWGGIDGLLSLRPEQDDNVVYSFHLYEPAELTALAMYRPGLDRAALARLPFPVTDPGACQALAQAELDRATAELMRFFCAERWDAAKVGARIAAAADWARRHHVFVLAGEFGASDRLNASARQGWLAAVRRACENQGIGWALWGYDDSMGLALRPPADRRPLDSAVLHALGLRWDTNPEALSRERQ